MFLLRTRFWLTIVKVIGLVFVGGMVWVQIPELRYDLGPKRPVEISGPEDLSIERFRHAAFVSIAGKPNFERAFVYRRYGLSYTYFNVEPFGMRLVVRTYDKVTVEWKDLNRFLGRLVPFKRQAFSYRVRNIYRKKFQVEVPGDAFFLSLEDVPRPNGWQFAAMAFAGVLWIVMFYLFFLFRRGGRRVGLF
jgi:hypothetical protein